MIELGKTDNKSKPTRLLDPGVLSSLSNLELVAKSVVEGFVLGLHRSPKYGFSQEFVEYRPYTEGDDPRHIDWNVYSRTDKTFIKLFKGETNSHLMLLLDTSASMGFGSGNTSKLQYGKYLAASLAYLSSRQHDAIGTMVFNNEIVEFRPPTSRSGTLHSLIHALDKAEAVQGTSLEKPFTRFREHVKKRGLVAVISDFYCRPEDLQESVQPLSSHGQDVILFHLLDPGEMSPQIKESTLYEDMETGEAIEVSPVFMKQDYPDRVKAHIAAIQKAAQGMNADYVLLDTSQPLDRALHAYLTFREKRS